MKERVKTVLVILAILGISLVSVASIILSGTEYQNSLPPKM